MWPAGRVPDPERRAVGLVEKAWRNSPVEDMHANRRGPSDGEMSAESVALDRVAADALANRTDRPLLEFERHLLDRTRPWAGGRPSAARGGLREPEGVREAR